MPGGKLTVYAYRSILKINTLVVELTFKKINYAKH